MRLLPFLLVATACHNPCQRMCVQMKLFAEDCGYVVSEAELDTCIAEQEAAIPEDKDLCRENGDLAVIQNRWDCEDAADYWGSSSGS